MIFLQRLTSLKAELKHLASVFDEKNQLFQIVSKTPDEIDCVFVVNTEKCYKFKAHITDNYPEYPAFWFTESDEPDISNLMDLISGLNNTKITSQIQRICKELCRLHLLPLPDEIQKLEIPELPDEEELLEPDSDSDDEVLDEDFDLDMAIQAYEKAAADKEAVIGVENLEALRHSLNKRYNNSEERITGTVGIELLMTSCQLQMELLNIWRSEAHKNKHYKVTLYEDSLFVWHVRLLLPSIDQDSPLYQDLVQLKRRSGKEGILLHFMFQADFPLRPPLVRVVEPLIHRGHVFEVGGVMCMELLMREGWSAAHTVETLILQIAATLVKGDERVNYIFSK